MCNRTFNNRESIRLDLKKHQMNAISVDNECFFSDHIMVRKPDALTPQEYKRAILCALPHEPRQILRLRTNRVPPADCSDSSD